MQKLNSVKGTKDIFGKTVLEHDHVIKTFKDICVFNNNTDKAMIGQVIPSVSPGRGAEYFHKTECFCFERQELAAGEKIELPVRFIVDPALPQEIGSLSLGYTLFDITDKVEPTKDLAKL